MTFMNVEDAAQLLRMEYAEMPGLALTAWQAQRLCNLSDELCDRALRALLESGFLRRTREGRYIQREGSAAPETMREAS
jgi:hypothetical protein